MTERQKILGTVLAVITIGILFGFGTVFGTALAKLLIAAI